MATEIPIREIRDYAGWFPGLQLRMAIDSVAEGNTEGQAWVVSRGEGAVALLWDKGNNVFYVSSRGTTDEAIAGFGALMAGRVKDIAKESGLSYFRARLIPDSLEGALPALFPGCELSRTVSSSTSSGGRRRPRPPTTRTAFASCRSTGISCKAPKSKP